MTLKNTTFTFLMVATMLSACAIQPKKEVVNAKYHLHFYGAQDDLSTSQTRDVEFDILEGDKSNPISHGTHVTRFPLSYAIECNQAKTACKHAVVKTDIEFTATNIDENTIKVSGILHSEMGRNLTTSMNSSSFSGLKQVISRNVPDSVELINEAKVDKPFDKTLKIGETLNIEGLAGVHIEMDFQSYKR